VSKKDRSKKSTKLCFSCLSVSSPEIVARVTRLMIFAFEISSALAAVKVSPSPTLLDVAGFPTINLHTHRITIQRCRIHLRHNQLHLTQLLDAIVCLGNRYIHINGQQLTPVQHLLPASPRSTPRPNVPNNAYGQTAEHLPIPKYDSSATDAYSTLSNRQTPLQLLAFTCLDSPYTSNASLLSMDTLSAKRILPRILFSTSHIE
jgi:hypothetical protein